MISIGGVKMLKNIKHKIVFVLFVLLILFSCIGNNNIFAGYRGPLNSIAIDFYKTGDLKLAIDKLDKVENSFNEKDNYEYYVFKGDMELLIGEMKEVFDQEEAEDNFSEAREFGEKALEEKQTYLAKRIYYESITKLFNYRGLFFILNNSKKAENLLDDLLILKPEDKMTLLLQAFYYVDSPSIAGGDKNKGIELLNEIKEFDDPIFNFIASNKLWRIYKDEGDEKKANENIEFAKKIFPDSPLIGKLF